MVGMGSIAVFGGSGNTGREVISAALRRGFGVRALYRPGSVPRGVPTGLEVVIGQLSSREDVRRVLAGTVGAVCVFGRPQATAKKSCEPDSLMFDCCLRTLSFNTNNYRTLNRVLAVEHR